MTSLIARVRSVTDAEIALAAGVDRIAVGPSPVPLLSAIGAVASGRCPVSLWWDRDAASRVPGLDPATALSACGADEIWAEDGIAMPRVSAWATVAPGGEAPVTAAAEQGHRGILVDGGSPRRLLDSVTIAALDMQCRRARLHALPVGFSGTMEAPDIPRLLALSPDRLVVDDVIRQGGVSSNPIGAGPLRLVRDLVAMTRSASAAPIAMTEPDRIFVRDWTVPLHLGAYAHERDAQRVRFTVEVDVSRADGRAADMRDVVTYDLITDAIARVTVAHVDLVETIAEDVAALVLAHPRVEAVDITVEKLDLGPGSLGCRIRRRRA